MKPFTPTELVDHYEALTDEQKRELTKRIKGSNGQNGEKTLKKNTSLTHKAIGKLVFDKETRSGKLKPLHNIVVELWDRDITSPDDFLGSAMTDINGKFEVHYDPKDAGKMDLPDLELRVYEYHHRFDKNENVRNRKKLIYTIRGDNNVTQQKYDFGTCRVPYWEYDHEAITPRVLITEEGEAPQSYGPGRALVMVKVLSKVELKKRKHIIKTNSISLDQVQADYPQNLTIQMEENHPGSSRSDDFFVDCLLNGMSSNILDQDPNDPALYWIHYHFNSYVQDGIYAMPNVDIKFNQLGDSLKLCEITISERDPGECSPNAPITKKTVVTPNDSEKWMQAKRIARVASALVAELDMHLCNTHLNLEQYAISAYRNIRSSPIRYLLFPHLKEVCLINHSANKLLLGRDGYITKATGFTEESINMRIQQSVGMLDWNGWIPRRKLYSGHRYAEASQLYWSVVKEFVDWYFGVHLEEIIDDWAEIRLFSDELVEHSNDVFLCNFLGQQLDPTYVRENSEKIEKIHAGWFDWNERMKINIERPVVDGKHKSVSRITQSEKPKKQDIENLKQVCRYVIHHATFVHWWSNSKQFDEGGELRYNTLGLRIGPNGIWTDESDDSVLPPPEDATMQLWISYMLSNSNFGFILKNEEKDIDPKFLELLRKKRNDFLELGVNIAEIPSRTNI